jgi:glycosyltransferase involved in cell wall biosynthesis
VHEFELEHALRKPKIYASAIASYRRFLEAGSWDVIIFQAYSWPLQLAVPILPNLRAKKVLVSHGYAALRWFSVLRFPFGLGQWARSVWGSLLMLRWVHKIDRWVFLSTQCDVDAYFDHTLARLSGHRGIRIIPNGVGQLNPGAAKGAFRISHQIPKSDFLFICVAYYSRGKNQGLALRAFRRANIQDSVLVFIGTEFNEWSRAFQALDARIPSAQKRGRIIWLENQTREDTIAAFQECDAFVLPSKLETQPISILEAMSCGKPWIALRAGCVASLPGGICVGTGRSMAQAMKRIAYDEKLRLKLSDAGRNAAAKCYSLEKHMELYKSMMQELIRAKQPSS